MKAQFTAKNLSIFCVFLLAIYFIFGYMDQYPISMWDESRDANNAIEMVMSGNWLITTFEHVPDFGNVKLPLLIWLQVISMHIFGYDEIGIRMPVALAVLGTCIYMYWYSVKYLENYKIGLYSILILISSAGYMDIHGARTGDFDGLLTLFTTIYVFSFYNYTQSKEKSMLVITILSVFLAVYTKSIAGLLFILPMFIYAAWKRVLIDILKSKITWIGIFISVFLIGFYIILRASVQSDYIDSILMVDTIGRAVNAVDGHDQPFWFYGYLLIFNHFFYWFVLLVLCIVYTFTSFEFKYKSIIIYLLLMISMHIVTISLCKSKLGWYILPNIPLCSMIVAIFINEILGIFKKATSPIFVNFIIVGLFFFRCYPLFKRYTVEEDLHQINHLKNLLDI